MSGMMNNIARKERIKQAIVSAFAEVAYPGCESIARQPETFDGEEIEQAFKGHHWRDLPRETVRRHGMVFLRPEMRHFYMPAFLLVALDTLPEETVDLDLYALKPPEDDKRFKQEYDLYTSAQKDAIRLFLEYARDEVAEPSGKEAARLALERYWTRAAQDPQAAAESEPMTTAEPARIERVRQAVRQAFADVPYPGDKAIVNNPDDWEGKDINLDFEGYHWRELPHAIVSYDYCALPLLSAKGLQFYLPAYIMAGLDGDTNVLGWTVMYLGPSKGHADDDFKRRYVSFTPGQRRAIRLFLEYVRDSKLNIVGCAEKAQEALDKYWGGDAPEQPAG